MNLIAGSLPVSLCQVGRLKGPRLKVLVSPKERQRGRKRSLSLANNLGVVRIEGDVEGKLGISVSYGQRYDGIS